MRIKLHFQTRIDAEAALVRQPLRLIRLLAQVRFPTAEGWSRSRTAILDTGNPVSILPHSIWRELAPPPTQGLRRRLRGIGTSEEATVSGVLGRVHILFHDDRNSSEPFAVSAFLLDNDVAPLLIGFEDVLTRAILHCDYPASLAYLDL